jgi:ABC-type protease/lipase transport system fused ATPase/permease subunit
MFRYSTPKKLPLGRYMRATETLNTVIEKCKRVLFGVAIFSLFINLLMLTAPFYMMQVFDRVMTSRSVETLVFLTIVAAIALAALAILDFIRSLAFIQISRWIDKKIGAALLTTSVVGALDQRPGSSIRGLRDLSTVRSYLTGAGIFPILDAPWAPIFLIAIFLLHPWLGWLALFGAVLLFTLALVNNVATASSIKQSNNLNASAMTKAESATRNAESLESMGMTRNVVDRWQSENEKSIAHQSQASIRSGAITATSKFFRLALQVGVLGLGAYLAIVDSLSPGAMIAASILMSRALAPVESSIGSWRSAVAAQEAYRRLRKQLGSTSDIDAAMPLPQPAGQVEVKGVGYTYRNDE